MRTMVLGGVCLVMFVACGGDDAGVRNDLALCESFSPCGGDPAGSWILDGFCIVDEDTRFDECPGATVERSLSRSGSVELNPDSSYQVDFTGNTRFTLSVSGSCLTGVTDCSSLQQEDESLSCTGDPASSCTCTGEDVSVDMTTGTWAVSDNTIAFTGEDGTETLGFCVEGNTLTLRDAEGSVTRLIR